MDQANGLILMLKAIMAMRGPQQPAQPRHVRTIVSSEKPPKLAIGNYQVLRKFLIVSVVVDTFRTGLLCKSWKP